MSPRPEADDEAPRLDGEDPHERASAVVAHAVRRGAWAKVAPLADDSDPLVRGAVAYAGALLGRRGHDLGPLVELLASRSEDQVAFAVEAVAALGDRAVPALVARAEAVRAGRAAVLRALAELDTPGARRALRAAAASPDEALARLARRHT